jgi:hypothetical protein
MDVSRENGVIGFLKSLFRTQTTTIRLLARHNRVWPLPRYDLYRSFELARMLKPLNSEASNSWNLIKEANFRIQLQKFRLFRYKPQGERILPLSGQPFEWCLTARLMVCVGSLAGHHRLC